MTDDQKIAVLKQIINTGACSITPPIVGYLVEAGIMTPKGFDIDLAKKELEALTDDDPFSLGSGGRLRPSLPRPGKPTKSPIDYSRLPPAGVFSPGQCLATPGALALGIDLTDYLIRHLSGDWGNISKETAQENEAALQSEDQLFSLYDTPAGQVVIVTEGDRTATTIYTPEED